MLYCATLGIIRADTRTTESDTVDIISTVKEASETKETIFINADEMNYYDAFFYETTENPIKGTHIDYKWGSLEPIRQYGQNNADDIMKEIKDLDSFWYVTYDNEESLVFSGFEPAKSLENNSYRAYRFVRL
jgi:hypothetical protein